jgi:hypothetical protein
MKAKCKKTWNKCDECGRFISYEDFNTGMAERRMITPDSEFSIEEYETLCNKHLKSRNSSNDKT